MWHEHRPEVTESVCSASLGTSLVYYSGSTETGAGFITSKMPTQPRNKLKGQLSLLSYVIKGRGTWIWGLRWTSRGMQLFWLSLWMCRAHAGTRHTETRAECQAPLHFSDPAPASPQPLVPVFSPSLPTSSFFVSIMSKYLTPLSILVEIKQGFSTPKIILYKLLCNLNT